MLRVAELIQADLPDVERAVSVLPPWVRSYAHELNSGVLVTLEGSRSWRRLPRRAVQLRRLQSCLDQVVAAASRVTVVGAVIRRNDFVLAAQRAHPPELAGCWEFPGGKVELGESPESALVRECGEELGVAIRVGAEFGRTILPTGALLLLYWASLIDVASEPQCREHAQLRWCELGELPQLAWLPSNRPFVLKILSFESPAGEAGR